MVRASHADYSCGAAALATIRAAPTARTSTRPMSSAIKAMDPAIVFANPGCTHSFPRNLGVTRATSRHTTLVTMPGIGLTPDAPGYGVTFKIPYMF